MPDMYDDNGQHTDASRELDSATRKALSKLWAVWIDAGYSPRDVSHVMQFLIADLELGTVVRKGINLRHSLPPITKESHS